MNQSVLFLNYLFRSPFGSAFALTCVGALIAGCGLFAGDNRDLSRERLAKLPAQIQSPGLPGLEAVLIRGGEFRMGSDRGRPDEKPARKIRVSPFYMDATPVTYRAFKAYVQAGGRKSYYWKYDSYNKPEQPVTGLTWHEAVCFLNWRSGLEGLPPAYGPTGKYDAWGYPIWRADLKSPGYRLPTEAEFEFAARGGLVGKKFPWGDSFDPTRANFDEGRGFIKGRWWRLSNVRDQWKNSYGLYGMAGNIWEWSDSWYGRNSYKNMSSVNPGGPESGGVKAIRGGSWGSFVPGDLRVSRRSFSAPGNYLYDIGFRGVRNAVSVADRVTGQSPGKSGTVGTPTGLTNPEKCLAAARARPAEQKSMGPETFGSEFRQRLARYIAEHFPESVYFRIKVDQQAPMTSRELADLIMDVSLEYKVNPVFLLGIMVSESGFGTVSFPRWFNNPMAYHWGNWKMERGAPRYGSDRRYNRRYRNLRKGFRVYSRGIRRALYRRAARSDLYRFHYIYVGYEAREWMHRLTRIYRELLGVRFEAHNPPRDSGKYIYLDW